MAQHTLKFKKGDGISSVTIDYISNGVDKSTTITTTTTKSITFDAGTWIGVGDYDIASGYTTPVYVKNSSSGNNWNMTANGNWGYQSSTAPTATYTIWATEEASEEYEYKFKNSTGYALRLYYDLDTVSSTAMSISNGSTYTLTCEPADMIIDVDSSTIDGVSLNDLVYWQRTSPTTGTKYTLGDSGDNVISLRSAGGATYTFTNKSYSPVVDYEYAYQIYVYVDGSRVNTYSDSFTSQDDSEYINLQSIISSSYFDNYNYVGYKYSASGTTYTDYLPDLTADNITNIYVYFTTPVTYYSYELRVRIDGVRQSNYDVSYDYNTSQKIYFENILSTSLYNNYTYLGYRTSSAGAIKTGDSYTLSSTSGTTLYIEFETPITYYPYNIYVYIDGDYLDDFNKYSSDNAFSSIDLSNILNSTLFSSYEFQYYTKNSSSTQYTSYTSVGLSANTETDIYVYFKTIYYPYNIYVYVDGDYLDDFNKYSTTNTSSTINLSSVLSSTLFSSYTFQYYTKNSSSTQYTSYTSVSLSKNSTVSIYVYFITPTYTVIFRHLQDGTYIESTTESITSGTTISPSNYIKSYTHYTYDHATNASGTTITSVKITSNTTINLYYNLVSYTITFRHMLGDSTQETSASIKANSTITLKDYAGDYSGYLYDHAENSDGDTITTLTVIKKTTIYLVYILNTVTITFNHYRGKTKYTTTSTTVNYNTTITPSSYKISTIPNCVYNSASTNSFKATANTDVSLYYIFEWTYEKVKGIEFNLTATEWNNLIAFVNDQRTSNYSFTTAVKGNSFTAAIYNEMVNAIGTGTTVSKGDIITATLMNQLVTNANNM